MPRSLAEINGDWLCQAGCWLNRNRLHKSSIVRTVDVADINRDGFDDIFVLDMLSRDHQKRLTPKEGVKPPTLHVGQSDDRPRCPRNTLFLNRGDGTYAEIAEFSGLEASEWSWTPVFLDVDLDGFEDLLISNGFLFDVRDADANQRINVLKAEEKLSSAEQLFLRKLFPNYATSPKVYRNRGDLTFEDRSREWGFAEVGVSKACAWRTWIMMEDLDVVVITLNGPALSWVRKKKLTERSVDEKLRLVPTKLATKSSALIREESAFWSVRECARHSRLKHLMECTAALVLRKSRRRIRISSVTQEADDPMAVKQCGTQSEFAHDGSRFSLIVCGLTERIAAARRCSSSTVVRLRRGRSSGLGGYPVFECPKRS